MNKAIFLDRDDTIIQDHIYLNDPKDIIYLNGVFEALKSLQDAGYLLLIATNQSGVAKGLVQPENLEKIHQCIQKKMSEFGITIHAFYYAPFDNDKPHPMRKPEPGMLLQGMKEFNIDASKTWMIGDRMTDVEAGHRAGMRSILLLTKKSASKTYDFDPPEAQFKTLTEAAHFILNTTA